MLKIGFIGCGGIARIHADRIKQLRNARIVAASDVVGATAQKFAADYGVEQHFETPEVRACATRFGQP